MKIKEKKKSKNILLDMSCSLLHHGHIRLIKRASRFGKVIISLTTDEDLIKYKKIKPELNFKHRKEILESLKHVNKVIRGRYILDQKFLDRNKIDILVQGSDYKKRYFKNKVITFPRTINISSSKMRKLATKNILTNKNN
jgi:glycerol-3-phosphate cytidylyltransferase